MQLNEKFQICLLALANRYPDHVVDINEALLGTQRFGSEGWLATDLIEMLQYNQPSLLQTPACLIVDEQKSEIFLLDTSKEVPAIFVHCRGKLPTTKGNIAARMRVTVAVGAIGAQR
jgi:hypothetical protein